MAIIGGVSFIAPLFGIAIGYVLARSAKDVYAMMAFYIVANGIFLVGVPLEHLGYDSPVLGGMKGMQWIRYRPGYIVNLIAGFYRSPDIMGLHAASVVMFCFCHQMRPDTKSKPWWLAVASWAFFCLLLAGRRKMIGMPFVFLAAWFLLGKATKLVPLNRFVGFLAVCAIPLGIGMMILGRSDGSREYSNYASTLVTESVDRTGELVTVSVFSTIQQTGIFGAGLGAATQGRYHMGRIGGPKAWQEDGVSRIFMELGLFGVVCVLIAGRHFYGAVKRALRNPNGNYETRVLQLSLISLVIAYAASFTVSHQQFSGDPGSGVIAMIFLGALFGLYVHPQHHVGKAPIKPELSDSRSR
ncbi:putative membrane protein [Rhodopirellula maiorica SM1]|uniref:Putative membrane protein n=2 Tax=Novipirellula TaxID=2795426 RepID=M5RRN6_9BACT|nr:putative membrane protein [Rhodopirellula maiorica SM1]